MNLQDSMRRTIRWHLSFGWWTLLLFLTLGIALEALHGFKVAWYLNVGMETRRLMWRLAHAHGAFLSLVHIAFAATLWMNGTLEPSSASTKIEPRRRDKTADKQSTTATAPWYSWASKGLSGASVGVPGGFFLGGLVVRGGDPGIGVLVLPVGAGLLLFAVAVTAWSTRPGARS